MLASSLKKALNITESSELNELNFAEAETKKNRLLQKKRETEEKLKQKREAMLSKHKAELTEEESGELCIFCKESKSEPLKLLSEVTIDNFFTKYVLKADHFRLCFRTCGHRIHEKCFYQEGDEVEKVCFLCRKPVNLLLPDFEKEDNFEQHKDF